MNLQHALSQLGSDDLPAQIAAAEWLAQHAEQASPAAARLSALMSTSDATLREWCASALESLGPPPADQLDRLASLAQASNTDSAYWAITLLGRAGGDARHHAALLQALSKQAPTDVLRTRADWAVQRVISFN